MKYLRYLLLFGLCSGVGADTYYAFNPPTGIPVCTASTYVCTAAASTDVAAALSTGSSPSLTNGLTVNQLAINTGSPTAAAWTTNGLGLTGAASTLTDSSSTGTITEETAMSLPAYTFAASNAGVTITNLDTLYVPAPAAGTNVTGPNLWSIHTLGKNLFSAGFQSQGGTISLNVSSNSAVNIGTGTTTSTVTLGGGSNAVTFNATTLTLGGSTVVTSSSPVTLSNATVKFTGVTTGTNADTLCLSASGVVLIQAAACTISSLRFKEHIVDFRGDVLARFSAVEVASYNMKANDRPNPDPNFGTRQVGLIAENIAKVFPECTIYENDMRTPKSYRQECVIAMLVRGEQELIGHNRLLAARLAKIEIKPRILRAAVH